MVTLKGNNAREMEAARKNKPKITIMLACNDSKKMCIVFDVISMQSSRCTIL